MAGAFGLRIEWGTSSWARKFQSPVTMRQNFKGRAAARAASAESAVVQASTSSRRMPKLWTFQWTHS
eukprot:15883387-Heterocapsa_arctica.AAC.1